MRCRPSALLVPASPSPLQATHQIAKWPRHGTPGQHRQGESASDPSPRGMIDRKRAGVGRTAAIALAVGVVCLLYALLLLHLRANACDACRRVQRAVAGVDRLLHLGEELPPRLLLLACLEAARREPGRQPPPRMLAGQRAAGGDAQPGHAAPSQTGI